MPINTLADLFNLNVNGLTLDQAKITINGGIATVSGAATVLGQAAEITATFSVKDGALATQAGVSFSSLTLKQMDTLKLLPKSSYQTSSLPDITFTNVNVTADPVMRFVTVTGDSSATKLNLGLASLPIANSKLYLQVLVPESGDPVNQAAYLDGTLQVGGGAPVRITLPQSLYDWQLGLQPNATANLSGGLADLTTLAGTKLDSVLPTDLSALSGFTLAGLMVQFNTSSSKIHSVWLSVVTPSWTIIKPDTLAVSQVTVNLNIEMYDATTVAGSIVATLNIFGVDVDITLPIPFNSSKWSLESYPNVLIPGIGDIVTEAGKLAGTGDISASLPPGLSDLGSLIVEYLRVSFDPVARTLSNVSFRLSSANTWTLPYVSSISLDDIRVDLSIAQPLVETKRQITGTIAGRILLGSFYIPVMVQRLTTGNGWVLRILYSEISVGLPDLMPLIGISKDDFKQALPPSLSIVNDISLTGLSVLYDFGTSKLSQVSFGLGLSDVWSVIPHYLEINSLSLIVEIDNVSDTKTRQFYISLETDVEIVEVGFTLTATSSDPANEWLLRMEMNPDETISLNALITSLLNILLPGNFALPASFPTVVCTGANLAVAPASQEFYGELVSDVTWPVPFAKTNFEIKNLKTALDIGKLPVPPATGDRPYTFTASGEFSFMSIAGAASFTTTNTGGDTIIAVTVSNDAGAIKLPSVVKKLTTGAQTGTETWNALLPTLPVNFADFGTLTLDVLINLTQNLFVMYGRSSKYGSIAFFTKKLSENNWGYFVAAKLADGFTFASLLPELSTIDGVLTFKNGSASIAYSSFDADTVQTFTSSVPQLSESLTVGGISPIQQGVNFYAALNFASANRGALFGNVVTLLSGLENKPDLVIYGNISKTATDTTNASLKALFKATLGDFTVLDVLEFHGVTFQYSRAANTEVTLSGDMKLTLDKGTPTAQVYPFHGDLKVTNARADFALTTPTAQNIVNPLGMTGVTIKDLKLVFSYVFATTTPTVAPAKTTLQLSGTATFGTTTKFDANLYLIDSNPVLAEVSLTQTPPLGIIALLASSVAGITYPDDYFDIKFLTGSAYYYKKSADPTGLYGKIQLQDNQQIARADGFNLQTTLSMFDQTVSIAVNVQSGGLTATGKMLKPFDLDFIEFTDTDFTGSPSLFLRLLQNEKAFGLKAGFKLFQENFATGELSIGKYSSGTVTGTNEAQIRGRLAYAGNVDMFVGTVLGFTYSQSEGFKITDWPFNFDAALQYAELMNGFSKGGCEKLVGMVFEKAVKTNFSVKPSFSSDATHYILTLKGTYSVALFDASSPFLEVATPDIPIKVDRTKPFSLKSLPDLILKTIADSAQEIVKSILNDPAKFSAFVATVGLVNASESLTANLICNGGEGGAESAEAVEAANAAKTAAETAKTQAQAATTTAEAEAAAADAAAAAARAAAAAGGVGGGLEAAAAAATAAAAASIAAGIAAGLSFGGGGGTKPVDAPQLDKASIANFVYDGSQLVVSWQRVSHAAAYRVELLSGTDVIATSNKSSSTLRATFSVDKLKPGKYDVQVRANASNYKESVSDKTSINVLDAVTVTLSASGEKLLANWNKVDSPNYEITLFKDGSAISTTTAADTQKQFDPIGAGAYTVKIRPTGDLKHVAGNLSAASNAITQLPAPHIVRALAQGTNKVSVICDSNVGYSIQLTSAGKAFGSIATGTQQSPAVLDVGVLAPGEYQVQIRANATDASTLPSQWAVSRNPIYKLAAPVITGLSYFRGEVTAKLQGNIANANGFNYQFADPVTGKPAGGYVHATHLGDIQLSTSGIPPGTYKVQVKATRQEDDGFDSEWSTSTMTITLFDRGTITSFTYANNNLTAAWSASAEATSYDFVLSEDEISPTQPVFTTSITPQSGQTTPPTSTSQPVAKALKGKTYTAYVRPAVFGSKGDWARSNPVAFIDTPTSLQLSYANDALTASWNSVDGAQAYQLELLDETGKVVVQPDPVTGQPLPTSAPISTLGIAAGKYTARVKAVGATPNCQSAWSATSNTVTKLVQPNVAFAARQGVDKIDVTCDYEGDRFDLQLVNGGKPLGSIVTKIRSQAATFLDASQLAIGEYQVQVRVGSADDKTIPSDWLIARNTIYKLAAPVVETLEHSTDKASLGSVIVTLLNTVPNAKRYEVQLVNLVDGNPIGSVQYGQGQKIQIAPGSDVPYGTYKVRVRATRDNNDGTNTDGLDSQWVLSTMTITLFERLTINSIAYANNMVTASWTASTVATSYDFLLSEDPLSPNQPVASISVVPLLPIQKRPPNSTELTVNNIPKGKTYTAYVRAVANGQTGDWSAGVSVTL